MAFNKLRETYRVSTDRDQNLDEVTRERNPFPLPGEKLRHSEILRGKCVRKTRERRAEVCSAV